MSRPAALRLAIVVVTFLAYAVSLGFPFIYDDQFLILHNPNLLTWSSFTGYFHHDVWQGVPVSGAASFYRPMLLVFFRLLVATAGFLPIVWHTAVIAVHAIAAWLTFEVALRITKRKLLAFVTAVLFSLHPVHVESVSWISGVNDPLMYAFLLGTVLCLFDWYETGTWWHYALSLVFAACTLLSKETAIILPFLVLVSAWAYSRKAHSLTHALLVAIPFFLEAALYWMTRAQVLAHGAAIGATQSLATTLLTIPKVLLFYLVKLAVPAHQSLFYNFWSVKSFSLTGVLLPSLVLLMLLGLLVLWMKRTSQPAAVLFGSAWLFLPLIPPLYTRSFHAGEIVHDRYAYTACFGFVLLLTIGFSEVFEKSTAQQRLERISAIALCCLYLVLTVIAQLPWSSGLLLFSNAIQSAPQSQAAGVNLAIEYLDHGARDKGLQLLESVTKRWPDEAQPHYNLAYAYFSDSRFREAEEQIVASLRRDQANDKAWFLFSQIELKLGNTERAVAAARYAVQFRPNAPGYHANLGLALEKSGDLEQARSAYELELKVLPSNPTALEGLQRLNAKKK